MNRQAQILHIQLPFSYHTVKHLQPGDSVTLSGVVYAARDAAHKRLAEQIAQGLPLPLPLQNAVIYYTGACPAPPGAVIGSCGPTTAARMDSYAPLLFEQGVACTIAKGPIARSVIESIKRHRALYFCATGGAGALLSTCIKEAEVAAYADLGPEAILRLVVEDMPLVVGVNGKGESLFL